MEDELTLEMHSEFQVDDETDRKHIVWSLLNRCKEKRTRPEDEIKWFVKITMADVEKHRQSYLELSK